MRAQAAADAAMATARDLLTGLREGLTSEDVRRAMQAVCAEYEAELGDDVIVSSGPQSAVGHEAGSGPISAGVPVIVDIWPRDKRSRCWADMTRSFVAGGEKPSEEQARYWQLSRDSLDRVLGAVRPGVAGGELFALSCEPFHEAGILTQLSKPPGTTLEEGYFHSLGHGVGLEIHERPYLGRFGRPRDGRRHRGRARVLPARLRWLPAREPRPCDGVRRRSPDHLPIRAVRTDHES
jgi:Xaa-Pro aminopeptidase